MLLAFAESSWCFFVYLSRHSEKDLVISSVCESEQDSGSSSTTRPDTAVIAANNTRNNPVVVIVLFLPFIVVLIFCLRGKLSFLTSFRDLLATFVAPPPPWSNHFAIAANGERWGCCRPRAEGVAAAAAAGVVGVDSVELGLMMSPPTATHDLTALLDDELSKWSSGSGKNEKYVRNSLWWFLNGANIELQLSSCRYHALQRPISGVRRKTITFLRAALFNHQCSSHGHLFQLQSDTYFSTQVQFSLVSSCCCCSVLLLVNFFASPSPFPVM